MTIAQQYEQAKQQYAALGVDTDKALESIKNIPISIHCWQGDDVGGFETPDSELAGGGIMVTGGFPGKARNIGELRQDIEKALSLIPGSHRLNLHAIYGDFGGKLVDRDQITIEHYQSWIDWANDNNISLDFNPSCFSHPKADDGFTLSSPDASIRNFWIEHVKRTRNIAAEMGKQLGSSCINNVWLPDGMKDIPASRMKYRANLVKALDACFAEDKDPAHMKDAVESKLFGIGSESYVVGSSEFYTGYGVSRNKMVCMDAGHYHPTETIADKISSMLLFCQELLLHVSRPVRWDSDHVVIMNDDLKDITREIIFSDRVDNIHIALDFFDASINRIGAWVTGTHSTIKGLLTALLMPRTQLEQYEADGKYFERLALMEESKTMPFGAVWNYYCEQANVPVGTDWIAETGAYLDEIVAQRS